MSQLTPSRIARLLRPLRQKCKSQRIHDIKDAFKNIAQAAHAQPSNHLAGICAVLIGEHIEDQVEIHKEEGDNEGLQVVSDLYESIPPHHRRHALTAHALSIILSTCPHHPALLTTILDVALSFNLAHESKSILAALIHSMFNPSSRYPPHITHPTHSHDLTNLLSRCSPIACSSRVFTSILCDAILDLSVQECINQVWTCTAVSKLAQRLRKTDLAAYLVLCTGLAQSVGGKESHNLDPMTHTLRKQLSKWANRVLQRLFMLFYVNSETSLTHLVCDATAFVEVYHNLTQEPTPTTVIVHSDDLCLQLPSVMASLCTFLLSLPTLTPDIAQRFSSESISSLVSVIRGTRLGPDMLDPLVSLLFTTPSQTDLAHPNDISPSRILLLLQAYGSTLRTYDLSGVESIMWASALCCVEANIDLFYSMNNARPKLEDLSLLATGTEAQWLSDMESLKLELIDTHETAERGWFAGRMSASMSSVHSSKNMLHPTTSGHTSQASENGVDEEQDAQWRWEDMMGCWVMKTPVVHRDTSTKKRAWRSRAEDFGSPLVERVLKKRRVGSNLDLESTTSSGESEQILRNRSSSCEDGEPVDLDDMEVESWCIPPSPLTVKTRRKEGSAIGEGKRVKRVEDIENCVATLASDPTLSAAKERVRRRSSNFASILANAQMNRMVLHTSPRGSSRALGQRQSLFQSRVACLGEEEEEEQVEFKGMAEPSSDDVLDLFACPSSEC